MSQGRSKENQKDRARAALRALGFSTMVDPYVLELATRTIARCDELVADGLPFPLTRGSCEAEDAREVFLSRLRVMHEEQPTPELVWGVVRTPGLLLVECGGGTVAELMVELLDSLCDYIAYTAMGFSTENFLRESVQEGEALLGSAA